MGGWPSAHRTSRRSVERRAERLRAAPLAQPRGVAFPRVRTASLGALASTAHLDAPLEAVRAVIPARATSLRAAHARRRPLSRWLCALLPWLGWLSGLGVRVPVFIFIGPDSFWSRQVLRRWGLNFLCRLPRAGARLG